MGSHFIIIFLLIKYISPSATLWKMVFRVTKLFFFFTRFDNYSFRQDIPLNPGFGRVLKALIDFIGPDQTYLEPPPPLLCWGLHFSSGLGIQSWPQLCCEWACAHPCLWSCLLNGSWTFATALSPVLSLSLIS